MTDDTAETVLQRKVNAQRKALGVGSVSMPRALGRALSIAADALWGLGLSTVQIKDEILCAERATARIGDDQLLILLERESGPSGLMALDRDILTGLIEVQTLGRVTRIPVDDRAYTQTDAAMMAPLLDAALPRFASMLAGQPDMAHLNGYGFGALVEDVQTAALALDEDQYHVVAYEMNLAQDTRTGRGVFLFPEPPKTSDPIKAKIAGKHEAALKLVPTRMQAVLTRIHIPLDKARALKPGDTLPVSGLAASSASLVVPGGHIAARGKLGQMDGFRAIRIGVESRSRHKVDLPDAKEVAMKGAGDQTRSPELVAQPIANYALDGSFDMALDDIAADLPKLTEPLKV